MTTEATEARPQPGASMDRPARLRQLRTRAGSHLTPVLLIGLVLVVSWLCWMAGGQIAGYLNQSLIELTMVIGLYIFVGNSGVFSFGGLGYAAIGGYVGALAVLTRDDKSAAGLSLPGWLMSLHVETWVSLAFAGVVAGVAALVSGLVLMRLNGIAASIGTFAVMVIVYTVASNWKSVTGGTNGITTVPFNVSLHHCLIVACVAIALAYFYQRSASCLCLRASREDEAAAAAHGVQIARARTIAFTLSGLVMGVSGALYNEYEGVAAPSSFYLSLTFVIVMMLVVGGELSLTGAVVGAIVIAGASNTLQAMELGVIWGDYRIQIPAGTEETVLSGILVLILVLRPSGITGGREWRRIPLPHRPRRRHPAAADNHGDADR